MCLDKFLSVHNKLEKTNCIICNSSNSIELHNFAPFKVLRCKECCAVFLSPRLEEAEIIKLYESDEYFRSYSENISNSYEIQKDSLNATFQRFIQLLQKRDLLRQGKLLEIGCAYGNFLSEVRPLFDYTAGIDFSNDALEKAKNHADIVLQGGIERLEDFTIDFDTIISINVIEHVYNPHEFVSKAYSKLSNNGVLILITPKFDGLWYRCLKNKWYSFKIPEHVCFYNHKSLHKLFSDNGFKEIQTFSSSHAFPLSVILSKLNMKTPGALSHRLNIWLPDIMIIGAGIKN